MTISKHLEEALLEAQLKAIAERRRKAELKAEKERVKLGKSKNKSKGGRPRIRPEIIEKAKQLAKRYSLCEVAFRLDICVNSLYNHGISRRNTPNKEPSRNRPPNIGNVKNER